MTSPRPRNIVVGFGPAVRRRSRRHAMRGPFQHREKNVTSTPLADRGSTVEVDRLLEQHRGDGRTVAAQVGGLHPPFCPSRPKAPDAPHPNVWTPVPTAATISDARPAGPAGSIATPQWKRGRRGLPAPNCRCVEWRILPARSLVAESPLSLVSEAGGATWSSLIQADQIAEGFDGAGYRTQTPSRWNTPTEADVVR